jgi:hypothetical protein
VLTGPSVYAVSVPSGKVAKVARMSCGRGSGTGRTLAYHAPSATAAVIAGGGNPSHSGGAVAWPTITLFVVTGATAKFLRRHKGVTPPSGGGVGPLRSWSASFSPCGSYLTVQAPTAESRIVCLKDGAEVKLAHPAPGGHSSAMSIAWLQETMALVVWSDGSVALTDVGRANGAAQVAMVVWCVCPGSCVAPGPLLATIDGNPGGGARSTLVLEPEWQDASQIPQVQIPLSSMPPVATAMQFPSQRFAADSADRSSYRRSYK